MLRRISQLPVMCWVGGALGIVLGFCAWFQVYWWREIDDNQFGWLTPVLVAYVLFDRRRELLRRWNMALLSRDLMASGVVSRLAMSGLGLGLGLLLVGAINRAELGPSLKGSWVVSIGAALVVLGLPIVTIAAPQSRLVSVREDPRIRVPVLLLYPALVWMLSGPQFSVVANQVSVRLLSPIAGSVAWVFNVVGFPMNQLGNLLVLPGGGRVGVEEACSGIRSFTACLYISFFLGAVFLHRIGPKLLLALSGIILAFVLNFFRLFALTGLAYLNGVSAIEGRVHDIAGYLVMGLTVVSLLLLLTLVGKTRRAEPGIR